MSDSSTIYNDKLIDVEPYETFEKDDLEIQLRENVRNRFIEKNAASTLHELVQYQLNNNSLEDGVSKVVIKTGTVDDMFGDINLLGLPNNALWDYVNELMMNAIKANPQVISAEYGVNRYGSVNTSEIHISVKKRQSRQKSARN